MMGRRQEDAVVHAESGEARHARAGPWDHDSRVGDGGPASVLEMVNGQMNLGRNKGRFR
jgi:hypothetical protein